MQGSFDFAYHENVHMDFGELLFTSLSEKGEWPDTWNEDQLEFLINSEAQAILINNEIDYDDDDIFFLVSNLIPNPKVILKQAL